LCVMRGLEAEAKWRGFAIYERVWLVERVEKRKNSKLIMVHSIR